MVDEALADELVQPAAFAADPDRAVAILEHRPRRVVVQAVRGRVGVDLARPEDREPGELASDPHVAARIREHRRARHVGTRHVRSLEALAVEARDPGERGDPHGAIGKHVHPLHLGGWQAIVGGEPSVTLAFDRADAVVATGQPDPLAVECHRGDVLPHVEARAAPDDAAVGQRPHPRRGGEHDRTTLANSDRDRLAATVQQPARDSATRGEQTSLGPPQDLVASLRDRANARGPRHAWCAPDLTVGDLEATAPVGPDRERAVRFARERRDRRTRQLHRHEASAVEPREAVLRSEPQVPIAVDGHGLHRVLRQTVVDGPPPELPVLERTGARRAREQRHERDEPARPNARPHACMFRPSAT